MLIEYLYLCKVLLLDIDVSFIKHAIHICK